MAHLEKYNRAAVGHLIAHYDRQAENIGNESVDRTRSHLNYNLAAELQPQRQGDFIKQRCSEVKVQKRKDVNVMCTWVVTAPQDLPEAEQAAFFKAAFDFMAARYGQENVISAYVHMDETTPHMHFAFVPVVEDKKKGGFKVSAKERIDRKELRSFHQELEQAVSDVLGHPVGILNEATKQGNMTIAELKQATALAAISEAEEHKKRADRQIQASKQQEKLADISIAAAHERVSQAITETDEAIRMSMETKSKAEAMAAAATAAAAEEQKKLEQLVADREYAERRVNELKKQLAGLRQEVDEKGQQRQELVEQVFILEHDIKAAESRLSELQGQVLTAEEAKKIAGKKVPLLDMVYNLTYKQYLDIMATATADEDVKKRLEYLEFKEELIRKKERKSEQKIEQQESEAAKKVEFWLQQADSLERHLHDLIDTFHLASELKREAEKRGYMGKEAILGNIGAIRKQYEQQQQQRKSDPQYQQQQKRKGRSR